MKQAFTNFEGLVAPLDRANVDTDAILPKQFMKSIRRTGFGDNLFDEWRYLDHGEPGADCSVRPLDPSFVLNQARYRGAQILLARENFGCGSSREHAPWALRDFGLRALIAPSFADIFHGNCLKNMLLPIVLDAATVQRLMQETAGTPGYRLKVDLLAQVVGTPGGQLLAFDVDATAKCRLLQGLDDIAVTLRSTERIRAYEAQRKEQEPWIFL